MNAAKSINRFSSKILETSYTSYGKITEFTEECLELINEDIKSAFYDYDYDYDFWVNNIDAFISCLSKKYVDALNRISSKLYDALDKCIEELGVNLIKKNNVSPGYKNESKRFFMLMSAMVRQQMNSFKEMTRDSLVEDIKANVYIEFSNKFKTLCKEDFNDDELEEYNSENEINDSESLVLYKIFSYKDMCDLAVKNGSSYKWSNGSHRIYEHDKSKKIIVVPAHELGLGLSKKIQKQIFNNKLIS